MRIQFKISFLGLVLAIFTPQFLFSQQNKETTIRSTEVTFSSVIGSGARAFGMGGAFIAIADDATAASWNPAGLAQLGKPEVSTVYSTNDFTIDIPLKRSTFPDDDLISLATSGSNLEFASFTYPLRKGNYKFVPQISYQRVINLSMDELRAPYIYKGGYHIGDTLHIFTDTFESSGNFSGGYDVVSASLGVQISSILNFGVAFNYWFGGQKGTQSRKESVVHSTFIDNNPKDYIGDEFLNINGLSTFEVKGEIQSDVAGFNLNLGALIKPHEKVNLGFVFRTPFTLTYEETELSSSSFNEYLKADSTSSLSANFEYPYSVGVGIAARLTNQLTISSDYSLSNWSAGKLTNGAKKVYRSQFGEFSSTIDEQPFPGNGVNANGNARKQNDAKQIRLGAEYAFLKGQWLVPIRAGFFRNTQFITDGHNASVNYNGYSVGAGVGVKDFFLDVALVLQKGASYYSPASEGNRKFESKQVYVSGIYRFDF